MTIINDPQRVLAQTDIDQLNSRLEAAERDRDEIRELLRESVRNINPHGKTILDLMNVWIDQHKQQNATLTAQLDAALAQLEAAKQKAHEENEWLRAELAREKGTAEYNKQLLQEIDAALARVAETEKHNQFLAQALAQCVGESKL